MDPSLLKTKNLHEVKHWIEPGTHVRPYHMCGNLLHWILKDTFQSFTKFSDWIFLSTDFVFRAGQLWLGPMELGRRGQVTISLPPISNQNFLIKEPLLSFSITFNFYSSEKVYVLACFPQTAGPEPHEEELCRLKTGKCTKTKTLVEWLYFYDSSNKQLMKVQKSRSEISCRKKVKIKVEEGML